MKAFILILTGLMLLGLRPLPAEDYPGLNDPLKTATLQYLLIDKQLVADSFDGINAAALAMKAAVSSAPAGTFPGDFAQAVDTLAAAKDIREARTAFAPVSSGLIATLTKDKVATGKLYSAYCPMRKAYWVQTDSKVIQNPYFGSQMLDCGVIKSNF